MKTTLILVEEEVNDISQSDTQGVHTLELYIDKKGRIVHRSGLKNGNR